MEVDKSKIQQNANLLASRGQFDKAIAEWKKLLIDSPADATVHNTIGDLYFKRQAISDAVEAYFQAGTAFQASGSALKAIAVYKKILKIDPTRYKVYHHLGDLNAERGLVNNAVSDYLALSKLYLKEGLIREALAVYRKIVNLDPTNLDARRRLADLCLQENLREEAVRTFLQLGKECVAQNRPNEAREAFELVLKIDPGNTSAERLLKNPHEVVPEDRPASASDTPATAGDRDRQRLLDEANRLINAGQLPEADAFLSDLLSANPGDPEVCRLLAMLHLRQGALAVALSEIQFLAEAAIRAEHYALAESMILEYLRADPACVALLELLGNLHDQSGSQAEAAVHYGRAIETLLEHPDPENPTRAAELYEKIVAIAPASPLVARFARVIEKAKPVLTSSADPVPATVLERPPVQEEGRSIDAVIQTQESAPDEAVATSIKKETAASPPPSTPDYRTHHELGQAYHDMGLLDEAMEEFRIALKSPEWFVPSSGALAGCLKEKGLVPAAIECLEQALGNSRCAGDASVAMRYDLGVMYQEEGLLDKAAVILVSIPDFSDVPIRLERIHTARKTRSQPLEAPLEGEPAPSGGERGTVTAGNVSPERKKRRISYL